MAPYVIPVRQHSEPLFVRLEPIGASASFEFPVREVAGYDIVNFLAISNLAFQIRVEEASSSDGPWTPVATFASVLVSGLQQVCDRVAPCGSHMRVFLDNLVASPESFLEITGLGLPIFGSGSSGGGGAQGFQGNRGPQGFQGAVGTGPQGNQGISGPQGNQGIVGAQGAQGTQGAQGALPDAFTAALTTPQLFDDFMSGDVFGLAFGQTLWSQSAADGGSTVDGQTGAAVALVDPKTFGYIAQHTGTNPTGRVAINKMDNQFRLGAGVTTWVARVLVETLSTLADEFICSIGVSRFRDPGALGVSFQYDRLTSVNWIMVCDNGGGTTRTPTAVPVVAATWVTLKAVVNAAATSVEFFINGVSVGTVITNIPDGATEYLVPFMDIIKSAGTTDRAFYADYYGLRVDLTTPR